MLHLYTDKSLIPTGKHVIKAIDSLFDGIVIDKEFGAEVINTIEEGVYNGGSTFIDRFGVNLYLKDLSTTSKIILCLYYTDEVIDISELGGQCGNIIEKIDGYAYTEGLVEFNGSAMMILYNNEEMDAAYAEYLMEVRYAKFEEGKY